MYNKVLKNYQVNVGTPYQVRPLINYELLRKMSEQESQEQNTDNEIEIVEVQKTPEDILEKAREEADYIIKEAHFEALKIIENAELEANTNKLRVEEEAFNKGYEEGVHQAELQYGKIISEAEEIKEEAKVQYKEILESLEADAVNTIIDIAKKVIGEEIVLNKENILYLVKQAFDKCANKESIVLKVSPDDYDYVVKQKDNLLAMVEGLGNFEVRKEVSLKPGACIVETPFGTLDAGVNTKLSKIEEAFRTILNR